MSDENTAPSAAPVDDTSTRNPILKSRFGDNWRAWSWLARVWAQFSRLAIAVIVAIAGAAGGYVAYIHIQVTELRDEVAFLKGKLDKFDDDQKRVTAAEGELAQHAQALTDHAGRIERLEDNYDYAQREAGRPPISRRGPKR